jgi:aminopeptidase 2
LWFVPLEIKVVDGSGTTTVKHDALDCQREAKIALPNPQSTTYKLNADTCGVCEWIIVFSDLERSCDQMGGLTMRG